jgi:hypothetical protein
MKKILSLLILLSSLQLEAQRFTEISAKYNDAFVEWELYTDDNEKAGTLNMIWQNPDDWSQWNYRIGEKTGTIKTKWNKDFSQWELRGENKIITAQMIWNSDPRQWRITDNTMTLELKTKWGNQLTEWVVDDNKKGQFYMYMDAQNDPRDWQIEDELDETVSFPMKMTLVFLTMFNSVPKK